jgi:4-hydroxy-2-oxoheptanedioate aldolase
MLYLRERVLAGELLAGTFCNIGSHITTEMAGHAGFDWLLLDLEHGAGDQSELVHQLQAAAAADTPAIVRIAWNEPWRFKRVLDTGAAGVMVPWVSTVEEAQAATTAMRYFPDGVRGAATLIRANGFGRDRDEYLLAANDNLLTVVQIETRQAVENAAAIAAVAGVDVLFVGPFDLSIGLGIGGQFDHPEFLAALEQVVAGAKGAGKAAGILLQRPDQVAATVERGFTFIALGSDGGVVANGMAQLAAAFTPFRANQG